MKIHLLAPDQRPTPAALAAVPHTRASHWDPAPGPWDLLLALPPLPRDLPPVAELREHAAACVVLSESMPRQGACPVASGLHLLHPEDLPGLLAQAPGSVSGAPATDLRSQLTLLVQGLERLHHQASQGPLDPGQVVPLLDLGTRAQANLQLLAEGDFPDLPLVPIQLSELLRDTAQLLRVASPLALPLQVQITPGIWVLGQAHALQQAVLHLAQNAWEAMPLGGTLTLSLSETTLERDGAPPESQALIQVRDTGEGMDADVLARALEPGFTQRRGPHRAGLGLPQAQQVLARHGGALHLSSRPGAGTSVDLVLPCLATGALAGTPEEGVLGYLRGTERILVVDPDPMVREVATRGLPPFGYQVTVRAGGQEALEAFRLDPEGFDLVFMELDLPGHGPGGADLGHRIRHLRRDVPIVLLTGLATTLEAVRAIHNQFTDLLPKPCTAHDLARMIRRHLRAPAPPPEAAPEVPPHAVETVLLAEDSGVTRGMIRRWLQQAGHTVHEAKDGQAAWDCFVAQRGTTPFSMVITDVVMPRMDGLELARRIRAVDTTLPIAVMTTVEDRETMKLALQAGVNEFLSKPFDLKALMETVEHLAAATQGRQEARRSRETAQAVRLAQRALLAVPEQDLPLFSLYEPLSDAGGDIFRAQRLADGSIFFLLADVAGHSVMSSYAVAAFLGMLSSFTGAGTGLRELAERLNRGIQEGPFAEIPVCALLGHWTPATGRLHLLNTGIPHAAWFEAAHQTTRWIELNGVPLGILETPVAEERVVYLAPGDRLLLGTDGFFEVLSSTRQLFSDQVPSQWKALAGTPVQWALSLVCEAARAHGEGVISDDLLVLGFEQPSEAVVPVFLQTMPNQADAIDACCDGIKQFLEPAETDGILSTARRFEIILALREALTNAMFHGNQSQPGSRVQLRAWLAESCGPFEVRVVDEGPGFDLAQHQAEPGPDSIRGRGIPLIRTCAEHVAMTASELSMTFTLEDRPHDQGLKFD